MTGNDAAVTLCSDALGRLMPMYLVLDRQGRVAGAGPTMIKLLGPALIGSAFFEVFQIRRPSACTSFAALCARKGEKLSVTAQDLPGMLLRAIAMPVTGGGMLINLSFGVGILDAVRWHRLTVTDFAPTELTIELLYVVEAKSAVMDELRALNLRLQGAKTAAEVQAQTDALTGLCNRRVLEAGLERCLAAHTPFALMHLDLDYFKQVNDTLGHAAGDHVLCEVGQILSAATRKEDIVARVGGDEFMILLPGLCDAELLETTAQRIIYNISRPIPFEKHECKVAVSIGMVLSADYPAADAAALMYDSDMALYEAKRAGRARARLHRPFNKAV